MSERKTRVKTGCRSCRVRRVKCDERKPTCERCEKANIVCNGYEAPKIVPLKRQALHTTSPTTESKSSDGFNPEVAVWNLSIDKTSSEKALVSNLGEDDLLPTQHLPSQSPHRRAQEALAYQQYANKTAKLLFHEGHLDYWKGFILARAWELEFVFDAVVALGSMHRAVLLLSESNTRALVVDTQILAFEAYGNALKEVHQICADDGNLNHEVLIATLILFTYFEVRYEGEIRTTAC